MARTKSARNPREGVWQYKIEKIERLTVILGSLQIELLCRCICTIRVQITNGLIQYVQTEEPIWVLVRSKEHSVKRE